MHLAEDILKVELEEFEKYSNDFFSSDVLLLEKILKYIRKQKGKRIRPLFVLLISSLYGVINKSSYHAALFVETLHTASLLHDDIVDNSYWRRGNFSINALWNNKVAVSVGDNLFVKSCLLLLSNTDNHEILRIFGSALQEVVQGELLQLEKSKKLNLQEDVYFNIIKNKTATLIAASCAAGAASTSQDPAHISSMYSFGENIGLAFQIKDDLLDYAKNDIGKPTGNDIKERKVTLPLIFTLNNCDSSIRRKLIKVFESKNFDEELLDFVSYEVTRSGGIQYSIEKMLFFKEQALASLSPLPESNIKTALKELVDFTIERHF